MSYIDRGIYRWYGCLMSKRSGTSRTYAEREAAGRPNRVFALSTAIDEAIDTLNKKLGLRSRSKVVSEGVRLLAAREKIKIDE